MLNVSERRVVFLVGAVQFVNVLDFTMVMPLGPDFSATYLHDWAVEVADQAARARFQRGYADLTPEQRAGIDGSVAQTMKRNAYDASSGTLQFSAVDASAFERQIGQWKDYFATPAGNGGLAAKLIDDPQELRQLTATKQSQRDQQEPIDGDGAGHELDDDRDLGRC